MGFEPANTTLPCAHAVGTAFHPIDLDADVPIPSKPHRRTKRKATELDDRHGEDVLEQLMPSTKKSKQPQGGEKQPAKKKKAKKSEQTEEKRLRRFRAQAPASYAAVAERAFSQRLCVLDRKRTGAAGDMIEELEVAGSTGNIYKVSIGKLPSCDCPYAIKGNQCKHIIYCMARTLKARPDLVYQLALTSTEVVELFTHAPRLPEDMDMEQTDGHRKPLDDDCPICYDSFNNKERIVWCENGCGNNIHSECFEKWAAQKQGSSGKVTCPFCRAQWKDKDIKISKTSGIVNAEGYRNVAPELGLSGKRDYSTYHSFWVRKQRREGLIDDDADDYFSGY